MNQTINLDDSLDMNDLKEILTTAKKNSSFLRGEAEFYNEHGDLLFKKHNLIVLPGKVFALEKLFNVKCSMNIPDLKTSMGVPPNSILGDNEATGPIKEKAVCLFCVGVGGSELTFGDVIRPKFRDTELNSMIPFRYVDVNNDLSELEKEKYYFRVETENNKIAYFLKKFDTEPSIKVKRIGTDIDADLSVQDEDFDVYVEMELKIDVNDVREYFEAGEGLEKARYNEIGLVYGVKPEGTGEGYVDYEHLELFSKLTFNNDALDSVSKELRIVYRVY